jgi:hypothetical protein
LRRLKEIKTALYQVLRAAGARGIYQRTLVNVLHLNMTHLNMALDAMR